MTFVNIVDFNGLNQEFYGREPRFIDINFVSSLASFFLFCLVFYSITYMAKNN